VAFNAALHPRGPNGRFTRSFAVHMSSLDGTKASKVKAAFHGHTFHGPDDAHTYLSHLSGVKAPGKDGGGGGIKQYLDNGTLKTANEALRAGKSDNPAVHAIDATMKPLPNDLQLFRSVPQAKFGKVDPKSLEGMKVSDAGYFPTTIAPQKSAPGSVQLHVQAPAGTPAAVDPDSGQVVLGHGAEMAVDSVDTNPDGSAQMNLTILPSESASPPAPESPDTPSAPEAEPPATAAARPFHQRVAESLSDVAALTSTPLNLLDPDGPPTMTPEQERGLDSYQSEDYRGINHYLRGGDEADLPTYYLTGDRVRSTVAAIDSAMDQSPLPQEITTLRGIRNPEILFGDRTGGDLTGMEWTEAAYVSTTSDPETANGFAHSGGTNPVVMRMVVPAGVGAVQLSDHTYESEVMLQRGLRMRVVADNGVDEHGVRQLDIEVIPSGG